MLKNCKTKTIEKVNHDRVHGPRNGEWLIDLRVDPPPPQTKIDRPRDPLRVVDHHRVPIRVLWILEEFTQPKHQTIGPLMRLGSDDGHW